MAGQSSSALTAQGAKVTNSPVASGTNISQTVNSPTVNLSLPVAPFGAPGPETRRCDFWLQFHPQGSRFLFIQNNGAEPAFDAVVHIPADGSDFKSDVINRLDNDRAWVACLLKGNFVSMESIRKVLVETLFHSPDNDKEVKTIPVLIRYRTHTRHSCAYHLEIRLPLQNGIQFALPQSIELSAAPHATAPSVHLNIEKPASEAIQLRRVEALLAIHSRLEAGLAYLQRAASTSKFPGEPLEQELLWRMGRKLAEASEQYSQNKLLINPVLTRKLDEFFDKVVSAGITLNLALDPMTPNGQPRADLWNKAQEIVYKEIPLVMRAIEIESRAAIEGDTQQS